MTTPTPTTPTDAGVRPDWVRVPEAIRRTGISRTHLYDLIAKREVRTKSLRRRGAIRGIRLSDYGSLLEYIESIEDDAPVSDGESSSPSQQS